MLRGVAVKRTAQRNWPRNRQAGRTSLNVHVDGARGGVHARQDNGQQLPCVRLQPQHGVVGVLAARGRKSSASAPGALQQHARGLTRGWQRGR
jgi:hypothetical protein